MRDERYLPFEGAGAISTWRLEPPTEFKAFDYGTISDVILHLRYTARDSNSGEMSDGATALVLKLAKEPPADLNPGVLVQLFNLRHDFRLFSLRHEFPAEWRRFVNSPSSPAAPNIMTVDLAATRFPYFVQGRKINVNGATVFEKTSSSTLPSIGITPGRTSTPTIAASTRTGSAPGLAERKTEEQGSPGPWTFGTDSDPNLVEDIFVILAYSAS